MDKSEAIRKIETYKLLLNQYFDIDKIVLFGSYAEDRQSEESDIDVAVVVKNTTDDYFDSTPILWKVRRKVDNRIEPLLFVKGKDESGFLSQILKTGIVI